MRMYFDAHRFTGLFASRLLRPTLAPLAMLALGGACSSEDPAVRGEPLTIEAQGVRDDAVANVRAMMDIAWRTEKFLHDAATLDQAETVIRALTGSDDASEVPPKDDGFGDEESATGFLLPLDDVDFDQLQADMEDELERRVFRDDQIESRTATSIVYRIDPANICDLVSEDVEVVGGPDAAPESVADGDDDCVRALAAVPLRVSVTSLVDGDIDLRVLVGADRSEAALIELHADVLAVSVNIGPLVDAFIDITRALDPESPPPSLVTARGTLRAALRRLSADELRASIDVVSPIAVAGSFDDVAIGVAMGVGSVALDVDRQAQMASLEVDVRDLAVNGPKELLETEDSCYDEDGNYDESLCETLEGTFALSLGRLAGIAKLIDNDARATVEGLIAGPLTFELDGEDIVEAKLNSESTPIDISANTAPELISIAIDGAVAGSLLVELARASEISPDFAEGWSASDLLTLAMPAPRMTARITPDGVALDVGTLSVTSRSRPDLDRTVEAGQCMIEVSNPGDEDGNGVEVEYHPFDFQLGDTCIAPDRT